MFAGNRKARLFPQYWQSYFCVDPDSAAGKLVFNRTVILKDAWAQIQQSQQDS